MWPRAAVEQFKFSRRGTVHNDIVEAMESILKHNKYNFKNWFEIELYWSTILKNMQNVAYSSRRTM